MFGLCSITLLGNLQHSHVVPFLHVYPDMRKNIKYYQGTLGNEGRKKEERRREPISIVLRIDVKQSDMNCGLACRDCLIKCVFL